MWNNNNNLNELIQGVIVHGPEILLYSQTQDDVQNYINRVTSERLSYPIPPNSIDHSKWFMPDNYCPNLIEWLFEQCTTSVQKDRVSLELELFVKHNMLNVLFFMKFLVDKLRENNIVWGVGRGSSVSSYVLFLIGVHKIDSIKYNLPIEEFFKGE